MWIHLDRDQNWFESGYVTSCDVGELWRRNSAFLDIFCAIFSIRAGSATANCKLEHKCILQCDVWYMQDTNWNMSTSITHDLDLHMPITLHDSTCEEAPPTVVAMRFMWHMLCYPLFPNFTFRVVIIIWIYKKQPERWLDFVVFKTNLVRIISRWIHHGHNGTMVQNPMATRWFSPIHSTCPRNGCLGNWHADHSQSAGPTSAAQTASGAIFIIGQRQCHIAANNNATSLLERSK